MKKTVVTTLEELQNTLDKYTEEGYLFRGQIKGYYDNKGVPTLSTSMSRNGCIPSITQKWSSFANDILHYVGYDINSAKNTISTGALLQHYGWRSFYLDVSNSAAISCWFAAETYSDKDILCHVKVHSTDRVILHVKQATYQFEEFEESKLYIIDREKCIQLGYEVHDLTLLPKEFTRPHIQKGLLIGPISFIGNKELNPEVIVEEITANTKVFRDYAMKETKLNSALDLFPSAEEDLFYDSLSFIPCERVIDDHYAYKRELLIPDYKSVTVPEKYEKLVAYYTPFWILDNQDDFFRGTNLQDSSIEELSFFGIKVGREIFYNCYENEKLPIPNIEKILECNNRIFIEFDHIINPPNYFDSTSYLKGIFIEKEEEYISIASVLIDHPSNKVTGVGISKSYSYKVRDGYLERVIRESDCPCGNEFEHSRLFTVVNRIDEFIAGSEKDENGNLIVIDK